jgi:Uma2 family endonuclease
MRRFTVDEYHRLIRAGILTENDPVELVEGWIVYKMPRNPPHDVTIELVEEVIRGRLPSGWRLRGQCAITTDDSEPEPDFIIVRGAPRSRLPGHPGPADIAVLIEVADTSLAYDRKEKGRLYGRAGIPCYWIINLVDRQIEVYSVPTGPGAAPGYQQRQDYDAQAAVPLVLDGQECGPIPVHELLP